MMARMSTRGCTKGILIRVFSVLRIHVLHNLGPLVMCVYGGPLESVQHLNLYGRLPYFEAHSCGSLEEECGYDDTLIDDSSARGGDEGNCSVGEDNLNLCEDVVMETVLMQSHIENDLHEDARVAK